MAARKLTVYLPPSLDAILYGDLASLRAARSDPKVMSRALNQAFLDFLRAECGHRPVLLGLDEEHGRAHRPELAVRTITFVELVARGRELRERLELGARLRERGVKPLGHAARAYLKANLSHVFGEKVARTESASPSAVFTSISAAWYW